MLASDYVLNTFVDFLKEESGALPMEYVLIGSIIAVVFSLFVLALYKDI